MMTEAKIKTPVRYDSGNFIIRDCDGDMLIDLEVTIPQSSDIENGEYTDAAVIRMDAIGNQIADALNRQSELEAEVKVLRGRELRLETAMRSVIVARCDRLHHTASDRHEFNEHCPVERRFYEALANTARGDDDGK